MFQTTSTLHGQAPNPRYLGGLTGRLRQFFALIVLLAGLGASQKVWAQNPSFFDESVSFTAQPTNSTSQSVSYAGSYLNGDVPYSTYTPLGTTSSANRPNPSLGTYDLNGNSALSFTGASLVADVPLTRAGKPIGTIISTRFYYRVYLQTATNLPSYTPLTLSANGTYSNAGSDADGAALYNGSTSVNLLSGLLGGGDYVFDSYYEIVYVNPGANGGNPQNYRDPSSAYQATFTVTPPAITPSGGVTRWQSTNTGTGGTSWFVAENWSNGVPTSNSDAIIPENTTGTNIIFPILNSRTRNYTVRNLTLEGPTNSGRAQLTIQNAVLHVYGNIDQESGGLSGTITDNRGITDSTKNSTLILAGANQYITGRLSVPDIIVAGSGVKAVLNNVLPTNTLSFRPADPVAGVIMQTSVARTTTVNGVQTTTYVLSTSGNALVSLDGSGKISTNAGSSETTTSFVNGIMEATGALKTDSLQVFGNIGLDFLSNHPASSVRVQRIIGDPLIGPTTPAPGVTPVPIKRQFNIRGDDNSASTSTAGSSSTVTFHYLPSIYELNGIKQKNLTMFSTATGAAPYTPVQGVLDSTARTVTRANLPSLSNFYLTLGDKTNPLPVSLVAFTAVRSGANTLLNWTTASEENNKGFNVQVSADGVNFHTLNFVASQNSNSASALNYKYTDTEAGKAGTRYYRLEQVDLDGKLNYSPVRAVSFDGAIASGALVAYPNPFTEAVDFTFDAAKVNEGIANVQLVDMTGRVVREQKVGLNSASLSLNGLGDLRSGLYVARITLPDGTTQTMRVQKQ